MASCLVAIVSAVLSFVFTRRNQRALETLRAELEDQRRERDARRDYEYEARKRLYAECGPVLLQLNEAADSALRRIAGLARTARHGNLGPDQPSWLGDSRIYFFVSTLYMLFAPLAVAKLLQRRLTLIDFSLDRGTYVQYALTRELLDSFSADFRLAARPPELPYQGDASAPLERIETGTVSARPQGLHRGLVDAAVETLVVNREDRALRILGFAEFVAEYRNEESPLGAAFRRIKYVIKDFHPRTHPVCWRILIAQAYLYRALLQTHADLGTADPPAPTWVMSPDQRKLFEWRTTDEPADDPFTVVESYLAERLGYLADGQASVMSQILIGETRQRPNL